MPPTYPEPLKVYFPHGGHYVALHWWTYYERGHLALAKTVPQMERIAAQVFKKHPDAEVKDVYHLEVVAPPPKLIAYAREDLRANDIREFSHTMLWNAKEVHEQCGEFPPQFKVCTQYEYKEDYSTEDWETEASDPDHNHCLHCENKVTLVNLTREQLFDRYYDLWNDTVDPPRQYPSIKGVPKLQVSRARPAQDTDAVWIASESFGHHSSGLVLCEVGERVQSPERVIFYFLRGEDLPNLKASLSASVTALQKQIEEQNRAKTENRHTSRNTERIERARKILTFFRKHSP